MAAGALIRARPWDVIGAGLAVPMVLWGFLGWFGTVGDAAGGQPGFFSGTGAAGIGLVLAAARDRPEPVAGRPPAPADQPTGRRAAGRGGLGRGARRDDRQTGQRHHPGRFGGRPAHRAQPGRRAAVRLAARQREIVEGGQRPGGAGPAGGGGPGGCPVRVIAVPGLPAVSTCRPGRRVRRLSAGAGTALPGGAVSGGAVSGRAVCQRAQYPGGQYSGGQYPPGQYPAAQYPGGQYPGGQYLPGQYPAGPYPGQQPAGQHPYPPSQIPTRQYPSQQASAQYPYPDGQNSGDRPPQQG